MANLPNINLPLPTVGADDDAWGAYLNAIVTAFDLLIKGNGNLPTLSTAGSSANFAASAGVAVDGTNASAMVLASALTKSTSAWAVGNNQGALDTGTIANNTWYHVYLIQRSDTGVVDVLISTNATSPTMPVSGAYDRKRRIGAMKTNGSAQWTKFYQYGDYFLWDVPVKDIDTTSLSTTPTLFTLSVPTGVNTRAVLKGNAKHGTATNGLLLYSPNTTAQAADTPEGNATIIFQVNNVYVSFADQIVTDTSGRVYAVSSASSTTVKGDTIGWFDPRGQW